MKNSVRVRVAGKLNLSLNITGRDVFHTLDSVFCSVSVFDTVTVSLRNDDVVTIDFQGIKLDPNTNTAAKAVEAVRRTCGPFGADITVEKGIPVGSGLGGSSADAAGVIAALDILLDGKFRGLDLYSAACQTGSDTAFMLRGGLARARGRGEQLEFFTGSVPFTLVLGFPASGVETAACYRTFDALYPDFAYAPADNDALVEALKTGDCAQAEYFLNALTEPAVRLNPQVGDVLQSLHDAGAVAAFMTGSGSGCVGAFARGNWKSRLPAQYRFREIELLDKGVFIERHP